MTLTSSPQRYGAVPIVIHWISAAALILMLISGLVAGNTEDLGSKEAILRVHVIVGVCVVLLTILRAVWWLAIDRKPADVANQPGWLVQTAHWVHRLIYLAIFVLGASGIATVALSGAGTVLFGGADQALLARVEDVPPFLAHSLVARLMLVLAGVHIGAALFHQFIRRDGLLARMGLGGRAPATLPTR